MAKPTIQEKAADYFKNHKAVRQLFATNDGFLFTAKPNATNHAKTLKDNAVTTIDNPEYNKVKDEVVESTEFLQQTIKTVLEELKEFEDVPDLELLLDEEKRSSQPRKTVVEAIEKRIKELG